MTVSRSNILAQAKRVEARQSHLDDVENRRTSRDPCFRCGTREDKHAEFGCGRRRGA